LWEYAGAIAFGRLPEGIDEQLYAFFLESLFCVALALNFVNIPFFNQPVNLKLRGILFGAFVWFLVRMAVLAFNIRVLVSENMVTSIVNLLMSVFYGCLLTCFLHLLEKKAKDTF
jgi:hypothetical protein